MEAAENDIEASSLEGRVELTGTSNTDVADNIGVNHNLHCPYALSTSAHTERLGELNPSSSTSHTSLTKHNNCIVGLARVPPAQKHSIKKCTSVWKFQRWRLLQECVCHFDFVYDFSVSLFRVAFNQLC